MVRSLKRRLYFIVARYFRFFAALKLRRWHPKIIVVTGSAGKTTLLHLLEAQLGPQAHYSHHANSSFGIPFDILGLPGVTRSRADWVKLALKAPFMTFTKVYPQKLYVAEVDTDRPKEGAFLGTLLQPDITLWVSALHTHTAQFDVLVAAGQFKTVEEAIAYDYGNLIAETRELVVIDGDNPLMVDQAKRSKGAIQTVALKDLSVYKLTAAQTTFGFKDKQYTVPALVPRATYYQVAMTDQLMSHLKLAPDYTYKQFELPPGRSNVYKGIKNTTIIDSTYNNSNVESVKTIIDLLSDLPAEHKWLVVGDMQEQGQDEAREHQKIAELLNNTHFEQIILEGPRLKAAAWPALSAELKARTNIAVFEKPTEVRDYIHEHLQGGEIIMFKGVRFLEGVIETLLADKTDAAKLVRREPLWQKRRKGWGL
ncbi:MAG: putative UDP-N-acetylmuramoyl-tripeptide--D-alanyl-D-alanine ligase [Candidatus Saccharibacteria bacterium]|nr:putative UDP-N-acetylmuramoyl-tripeptide--D-alanyl-D-alanine ligase [Candidatus Saccharibacteria bacterium]